MSAWRLFIVAILLAATTAVARAAHSRSAVPPPPLDRLPYAMSTWHGDDAGALDADVVKELQADSYLNRTYADASGAPVGLYVAYYARQRPGVSIHSPLNCLPGTGWEPFDIASRSIVRPDGSTGELRRLVVRKALDRAVVLYWYSVHGRMLASELRSKASLIGDGLRYGRSDASLVRIVVPVADSVDAAEQRALLFARDLLPHLSILWS